MANPIKKCSASSFSKYKDYALTLLQTYNNESVEFVLGQTLITAKLDKTKLPAIIKRLDSVGSDNSKAKLALTDSELVIAQDTTKNRPLTVGDLSKPNTNTPFGYLGELFLQAAITAMLTERSNVTKDKVVAHIEAFLNSKETYGNSRSKNINRVVTLTAKNKGSSTKDIVESRYSLNSRATKFLESRIGKIGSDVELDPFIRDAIHYVNSGEPQQHAEYFFTNGRKDKILIEALGVIGQNVTKADIKTSYYEGYESESKPGNLCSFNLNLSVKIRNEDQFGQVTGIDSKTYEKFAKAAGITLSKEAISEVDEIVPSKTEKISDTKQKKVYEIVYSDMHSQIKSGKVKAADVFDGIYEFISLRDSSVTIVDIGSGTKTYFIKYLLAAKTSYANAKVTSVYRKTESGNCNLIVLVNGREYVQLSSRKTGGAFRNFVTSREGLRHDLAYEQVLVKR